jgi:hypothetical protein
MYPDGVPEQLRTFLRTSPSYGNTMSESISRALSEQPSNFVPFQTGPNKIKDLTILLIPNHDVNWHMGPIVLLSQTHLHTFVHARLSASTEKYFLPKSITRLSINSDLAEPVHELGSLSNLVDFTLCCRKPEAQDKFMQSVVWPKSLLKLTLTVASTATLQHLEKLPSTLTSLTLDGFFYSAIAVAVPRQCESLTSLDLRFRNMRLVPDAYYPPSLTRLDVRGLDWTQSDLAERFESLPSHIVDFSSGPLNGAVVAESVAGAYRALLSRLVTLESVERAIDNCMLLLINDPPAQLVSVINARLARFGLDHRYLDFLVMIRQRSNLNECLVDAHRAVLAGFPDTYFRMFVRNHPYTLRFLQVIELGGDDEARIKFVEWAFTLPKVKLLHVTSTGDSRQLPPSVCARVKTLILCMNNFISKWSEENLDTLLSSGCWSRLRRIDAKRPSGALSLDCIAHVLYKNRHLLPRLEAVFVGPVIVIGEDSVRMLAEMKLFEGKNGQTFEYYVEPPRHVLGKYPFLRSPVQ